MNGFIGHHLSQKILADTAWEVYGMDPGSHTEADMSRTSKRNQPTSDSLLDAKAGP